MQLPIKNKYEKVVQSNLFLLLRNPTNQILHINNLQSVTLRLYIEKSKTWTNSILNLVF